ncbi:MAG: tetratricopeptide repeat protein, partial [Betaproteobacteria bacterium]
MNQSTHKSKLPIVAGFFAIVAVLTMCAVTYWKLRSARTNAPITPDVASVEVVADFFTSLAALDVEESELAARVLKKAVRLEPREPALWANLTVAHMRLRDMDSAHKTLETAMSLASGSRELALLQAEVSENSGDIEHAIEQLRKIHQDWPDNIAATYSLFSLLGRVRSNDADGERLALLSDILARATDNLRARCEHARLAATLQRDEELRAALDALLLEIDHWPDAASQHLKKADAAARANDFRQAAQSLTFFENLVKQIPAYQQSLAGLGVAPAAAIGTPQRTFLRLQLPPIEAAEADIALKFELQELPKTAARPDLVLALEQAGERRSTLMSLVGNMLQVGESAALPFPGSSMEAIRSSVAPADLNFDFRQDLIVVGDEGCRVYV